MKFVSLGAAVLVAVLAFNATPTTGAKPTKPPASVVAVPPPFLGAVLYDITYSRDAARVAASLEDFTPIFDRLRVSGGEVGFGLIREDSNRPLIRCYVPVPPPEPPALPAPAGGGNVFVNATNQKRYEAERKKHEAKRRAWEADANARINAFIALLRPLLASAATAGSTDLTAAVERGDLMLAEPSPFTHADTAIILITDGIHNATVKEVPSLRSHAPVAIVNGVGSLGALAKLNPPALRFESTAAAIRYLTADGGANAR